MSNNTLNLAAIFYSGVSSKLLSALEIAGVGVAAVSGALAAGRKKMDLFGLVVTAIVTAVGGGTIRDVLLDRRPLFWVANPDYLLWATVVALVTVGYARVGRLPRQSLLIADAFALAFFTVSGARLGLQAALPAVVVVLMAAVSGVAGGAIRDILCDEMPMIFRGEIYAIVSLAGAAVYVVLERAGASQSWSTAVAATLMVLARLAAIFSGAKLALLHLDRGPEPRRGLVMEASLPDALAPEEQQVG